MPGPRATKDKLYKLAQEIERVTGIDPIEQNQSFDGTESGRHYYWRDSEIREWFDANGAEPGWVKSPHVTKGTGPTVRVLSEILGDAVALLAINTAKNAPVYVSDDYITRNIAELTPASHHYLIQIRSDNPLADEHGRNVELSANGGPVTYPQTKWMSLTPEQLARIVSVL